MKHVNGNGTPHVLHHLGLIHLLGPGIAELIELALLFCRADLPCTSGGASPLW